MKGVFSLVLVLPSPFRMKGVFFGTMIALLVVVLSSPFRQLRWRASGRELQRGGGGILPSGGGVGILRQLRLLRDGERRAEPGGGLCEAQLHFACLRLQLRQRNLSSHSIACSRGP